MISAQDIQKLFERQLAKIEDAKLREGVVKAWVLGCERGGYTSVDQLMAMPYTLLTDTHGVSFPEHTIAVTDGAIALAEAQLSQSKALYDLAKASEDSRSWENDITQAEMGVEQAQVALELAEKQLSDATITAPISGIVSLRSADLGGMVGTVAAVAMPAFVFTGRPCAGSQGKGQKSREAALRDDAEIHFRSSNSGK